jgi:uncharacterized SAM-binding protein YcdF (DUF218 family)
MSKLKSSSYILLSGLVMVLVLMALFNVRGLLLRPLETRFPELRSAPTDRVDGIILLGGFHIISPVAAELDSDLPSERVDIRSDLSERVTETVRLSKLYPNARILYSGGGTEAQLGKKLLMRLGVEPERIIIENRSQNTAENAKLSKIIAAPKPSEKWLLVTSGFHMPRAIGAFTVGFRVQADPVDFRGPRRARLALREYIALLTYWLSGRSNELFPSP